MPADERAPDSRDERAAALATQSLEDARIFLDEQVFTEPVRTNQRFRDAFEAASRDLPAYGPIDSIALRADRQYEAKTDTAPKERPAGSLSSGHV